MGNKEQYCTVICALTLFLIDGCQIGWISPTIVTLLDPNLTPLDHTLTEDETSFVGGISIVIVTGVFSSGFLSNILGRKKILILCAVLFTSSWLMVAFSKTFLVLCIAKFIGAQALGMTGPALVTYITEITSPHIRGTALAMSSVFMDSGILLMYSLGPYVSYRTLALVPAGVSMITFICLCFVSESPVHLLKTAKTEKLMITMKYLGLSYDNIMTIDEYAVMLKPKEHGTVPDIAQDVQNTNQNKKRIKLAKFANEDDASNVIVTDRIVKKSNCKLFMEIFQKKQHRKALFLACIINFAQQSSGVIPVLLFTTIIFVKAASGVKPHIATIILGAIQLISIVLGNICAGRFGRRQLLLLSIGVTIISNVILGAHLYLEKIESPVVAYLSWLPLTVTILYIIFYCMGLGTVVTPLTGELFDIDVRSIGTSMAFIANNATGLLTVFIYGLMSQTVGDHWTFWIFALCGLFSFAIVGLYMPETKGRRITEIQNMLNPRTVCDFAPRF